MRVIFGSFKVRNKLFSSRDQDSVLNDAIGRPSLRLILLGSMRRAATKIAAHSRQMKVRYTAGGTPDEDVLVTLIPRTTASISISVRHDREKSFLPDPTTDPRALRIHVVAI